ncbi:sulfite exporter TauE/SafE family protein [Candidatus Nitrosotenuis cloacae]|uniref:Probable membrane transporter protein n=1 Tax=Candidatus Nitrosotenuis cloacae TaxID=1603555 RepID=A0A3G1B0T5_9ARCH|nr:sulfite exporter TauE/SafE family protein [Candidatus Nitrosotenuis cloacae]AJZ75194.1 permease [Candidatus Nitrosotenuis cloacae]
MFESLWLIPLGFVAGVIGSIIGLGGGIVVVPVLTFLGVPHTISSSSSLFAAFSNSVASTVSYSKQKRVDYKTGLRLGLMSIPGTILGAVISAQATPDLFKILFAVVLIASCYYLFIKKNLDTKQGNLSKKMLVASSVISFFAGILSSFFGIGGGIIFVPLMMIGLGLLVKNATATSQLILMFSSASGMITHTLLGHADFEYALLLSIGAFAGGLLGARLSLEIKENRLRLLIVAVILIAAIKLILDSMGI